MNRVIRLAIGCSVSLLLVACVGGSDQVCIPGVTQECLCLEGKGVQSCQSDGLGYTTCECKSGTVADVGPSTDGVGADQGSPDSGETCTPKHQKTCQAGDVVWLDSCGNYEGIAEACGENKTCSGDTCIDFCTPHSQQYCFKNDIYWYDSCGNAETPSELCGEEKFCHGCTIAEAPCEDVPNCVKPLYSGTWLLTADPKTQQACGGLVETQYFDQKLALTVDGSQASGTISVAGITVNYTGTVTGKDLLLTGTYTQTDLGGAIEHTETIEVTFSSLTAFSGLHIDSYTTLGVACTVYWDVTGTKQ